MPHCFPTPMLSQSTGVLVPRSWPLHLPQTGTNACLTLFHLTAFELNCSERRDEGSRGKERGNEPKLQLDNKLCSLKMPQIKFFFSDIFSVSYEKTLKSLSGNSYLSELVCVCVCVCVCVRVHTCTCTHSVVSDPVSPWTVALQFFCPGSSLARILGWVTTSYSRRSSQPGDWTHLSCISCIGRQILYHLGSPHLSFLVRSLFKFSFK